MTTQEDFMEKCNGAPFDMNEVAESASLITDNDKLARAAQKFLKAEQTLELELNKIGFEFG